MQEKGKGVIKENGHRTSLLEYYKTLLSKISFDPRLVDKEYSKALQYLSQSDRNKLEFWLSENLNYCFNKN